MQSEQRSAQERRQATSGDERRRAAMQPSPTPEEAKESYEERLETMDNPPTPSPTQEEADAMKTGEYASSEAHEARAKRQQRDMKPEERAGYRTR
jgi:hypothetical protein